MALSKAAQRKIMRDDAIRRLLREQGIESQFTSEYDYANARNLTGVPSASNRIHRAHDTTKYPRGYRNGHTVGTADGTTLSVKVTHADGTSEIRPVADYHKTRNVRKRANVTQVVNTTPETARVVSQYDQRHAETY